MKKMTYQDDGLWFRDDAFNFGRDTVALPLFRGPAAPRADVTDVIHAAPTTKPPTGEISFLNALNRDDTLTSDSYWGSTGRTAFKWGDSTAGTGATISYSFKGFTATEQATILKAFAMWESVADVHFVAAANQSDADVLLKRGHDGGAYTSTPTSRGQGSNLGDVTGQATISIDTSVPGFDLSGSFDTVGGYGVSTIVHELGHLLGLGHGGAYNGAVDPATQQYSAYDDRMYTIMSYIFYANTDAKFGDQNPYQGTDWGVTDDGYLRQAPHSVMALDILAIQQLYGAAQTTPLDGGTIYGFNCNITGLVHDYFDFTVNTDPVVTLFNEGTGNTLDCSGYNMGQTIDLHDGTFSDIAGHENNVAIAVGTRIETAIGGTAGDTITANDLGCELVGKGGKDALFGGSGDDKFDGGGSKDVLFGYGGQDTMTGGVGADTFAFTSVSDSFASASKADVITDFSHRDTDHIDLSAIDAIKGGGNNAFTFIGSSAFSNNAGELRFEVVGGDTLVSGDTDGNGNADFIIRLDDVTAVVAGDFVL